MQICVCGSRAERLAQSLLSRSRSRSRVGGGGADKDGSDGPDMAMQMNPRLMQDLRSSASDGSGGVSAELIESLDDAPSAATWSQLRGSLAQVLRNAKSLATENAALKKSLERAAEAGGDTMAAAMGTYGGSPQAVLGGGAKNRREFAQVGSAGGSNAASAASMRGLASYGSSRQLQGALQRSPSQRPASLARPGSSGALSSSGLELASLDASSSFASANPLATQPSSGSAAMKRQPLAVTRRSTSRSAAAAGAGAAAATESPLAGLTRGGASGAARSDISPLLLPMEGEGAAPAMEPLPLAQ